MLRSSVPVLIGLALATVASALPLISVVIAATMATALGCQLDEGSVHPCLFAGVDIGATLYIMGVMGWFMLITLPVLGVLLAVWVVYGGVLLVRWGVTRVR